MKRPPVLVLVLFGSVPALACSAETLDGGSTSTQFSCDNRSAESTCADFPPGTTEAFAKGHCDGTVAALPCPREDTVGSCTAKGDSGEITNVYYRGGPKAWTQTSARETCETTFSGTFHAP